MKETANQSFLMLHKIIERHEPQNDTLLSGRLGLALYYQALYEAFEKPAHAEKATVLLEQVLANFRGDGLKLFGNAFGGGGAGLGYVITEFCKARLIEASLPDDLEALDDYLYRAALEQIIQQDKIDFLHGATGTIHYFTRRLPDDKIEKHLTGLITALCNKVVQEENGIWFRNRIRETKEIYEINLSLSHGLCSFLVILINAWNAGVKPECVKETVKKGVSFILSHQKDIDIPSKKWSFFPSTVSANNFSDFFISQRLAWCYGDFGPVLLLYKAATILNEPQWIEKADLFGTFTLMRKEAEDTAATETLFCHGTAGIAQFYDTFYRLSGIDRYLKGRDHWINKTIEMLPDELEKAVYHGKECDLLEGLVGINLSLLSFISEKPLSWGKALLLE